MKITLTEAEAERIADRNIMNILSHDKAYNNAENADDAAEREDQIAADVWAHIEADYKILY